MYHISLIGDVKSISTCNESNLHTLIKIAFVDFIELFRLISAFINMKNNTTISI